MKVLFVYGSEQSPRAVVARMTAQVLTANGVEAKAIPWHDMISEAVTWSPTHICIEQVQIEPQDLGTLVGSRPGTMWMYRLHGKLPALGMTTRWIRFLRECSTMPEYPNFVMAADSGRRGCTRAWGVQDARTDL